MGMLYRRITATLLILFAPAAFAQPPPKTPAPIFSRKDHSPRQLQDSYSHSRSRPCDRKSPPGPVVAGRGTIRRPARPQIPNGAGPLQEFPGQRNGIPSAQGEPDLRRPPAATRTPFTSPGLRDTHQPPGRPGDDLSTKIAMDRDGNVYVAGVSDSTLTIFDVVIIKYDSSGDVKWTLRYDGPGHLSDSPAAIVVDDQRECDHRRQHGEIVDECRCAPPETGSGGPDRMGRRLRRSNRPG